jgi:predicted RNA-binding protein with TRAM domain
MNPARYLLIPIALSSLHAGAQTYDARIDSYVGLDYACNGLVTPVLRIQNMGSATMSTCVVETWKNGLVDNSFNWILAVPALTGAYRQPAMPTIPVAPGDQLEFRIITVNTQPDEVATGNILTKNVDGSSQYSNNNLVKVEVLTDDNPGETTWTIVDDLGNALAQGGPYTDPGTTYEQWASLPASDCLALRVADSGGDGMAQRSVPGHVKVIGGGATILTVNGDDFAGTYEEGLRTGSDPCAPTQLTVAADPFVSCGATGLLLDGTSVIAATEVPGANKYQFRFRRGSYTRYIAVTTRSFALTKWRTKPLRTGKTYDVDVRASFDSGSTWCPFGPVCQITTAVAADAGNEQRMAGQDGAPTLRLFPNPCDGSRIQFRMEEAPEGIATIGIMDAMGRALFQRTLEVGQVRTMEVDPPTALQPGIYFVRCTFPDGGAVTERLIVR